MLNEIITVVIASALPIAEVRGGIPLGVALGLDPVITVLVATIVNILIFFPVYFGLDLLYKRVFARFRCARGLMERTQKKGKPLIEKYGIVGLAIFVGIPLPFTGAWTGTCIAWLFGLDWKRSFAAIAAGVVIASAIVSLVVFGAIGGLSFFIKPT